MTTQMSKSLRGKERQSAAEDSLKCLKKKIKQERISVDFGRSKMRVWRSAGKGRRTTLVSDYVSSSRSSHFSGSHRPPPLHHRRVGRGGQKRGGGRKKGGTARKTLCSQ